MSGQLPLDIGNAELLIVKNILNRHAPDSTVWVLARARQDKPKNSLTWIFALRRHNH